MTKSIIPAILVGVTALWLAQPAMADAYRDLQGAYHKAAGQFK